MKQARSPKPRSAIWVQLGCNKTSRGFLKAPTVATGAVKLQLVTSGRWTVTAEVASSSLVVPAILSVTYVSGRSTNIVVRFLLAKRSGQTLGTRSFVHDARRIVQLHSAANCESTEFRKPDPGHLRRYLSVQTPGANDSLVDQLLSLRLPQHQAF
jgi:hypothetical protein